MAKNEGYICVFDCESVPDVELIRKTLGFEGSDLEVSLKALQWQKNKVGMSFCLCLTIKLSVFVRF